MRRGSLWTIGYKEVGIGSAECGFREGGDVAQFDKRVFWPNLLYAGKPLVIADMKAYKKINASAFLAVMFCWMLATSVHAQTFTLLHSFAGFPEGYSTNTDGALPSNGVVIVNNMLYGTTSRGGLKGYGTVYALSLNGTSFTNLYTFTNGTDGGHPYARLVASGGTLYGTAYSGGSNGEGTVFAITTNGMDFTNLYTFGTSNAAGANPCAGMILSSNMLYGTTYAGVFGTVFRLVTNGSAFTNLYVFDSSTNAGTLPVCVLILSGNTLYGTTLNGPRSEFGTVFAINTDGTDFTNIYIFYYNNYVQGSIINAGVVQSGNTLYGDTSIGGVGSGTIFAINTDGSGLTNLYNFTALAPGNDGYGSNTDGADPVGGFVLAGNTLYGAALGGGAAGEGTLFKINTDGSGFQVLHSFSSAHSGPGTNNDGANPNGLTLAGNTLYGTTSLGGLHGTGTVFSLSLPVELTIALAGTNVVLTWPVNTNGFVLQSTTSLTPPASWSTVSPAPTVVGAENVVTNAVAGAQMFYRLSQ